jgi:hypothetical protein
LLVLPELQGVRKYPKLDGNEQSERSTNMTITIKDIYYRQNEEVFEYKDIYIETNIGVLRLYVSSLRFVNDVNLQSMHRVSEIDGLKVKYGDLNIVEVRRTYDNDIFFLISGRFILAVEYILNSNFKHSVQDFRIIEDLDELHKRDLEDFKELDKVELPSGD